MKNKEEAKTLFMNVAVKVSIMDSLCQWLVADLQAFREAVGPDDAMFKEFGKRLDRIESEGFKHLEGICNLLDGK